MKPHSILILIGITLATTSGCGKGGKKSLRGEVVERLPRLEVVEPTRKRLVRRLEVSATVEGQKRVELSARVPGEVQWLPDDMDIGRKVKQGEVLLKLKVPELDADLKHKKAIQAQSEKQLEQAKEALAVARQEVDETEKDKKRFDAEKEFQRLRYNRIVGLVRQRAQEQNVADEARKQYDAAAAALDSSISKIKTREAKVKSALADIQVASRRIDVAKADVQRLVELQNFAVIKAPFNGVITRRWVDPGAVIRDAGAKLFTVVQMNTVRILLDIPQRDAPLINSTEYKPNPDGKGDEVTIVIPDLKHLTNKGQFVGNITRMARSLDPVTRTMRAEVIMPNDDFYLQPGMYGTASVKVEDRANVLTVPASALVRRGEGKVEVFVVANPTGDGDERRGVLRAIPVTLGIDDGKEAEIREGLTGKELVVARGSGSMRAGDKIIAVSEREANESK